MSRKIIKIILFSIFLIFVISAENLYAANFRCISDNFKKNIGEWGKQCVVYVRDETEIPYAACNGDAWTCYEKAREYYKVGNIPYVSSIIVFGIHNKLPVGHVGIIKAVKQLQDGYEITIRHSNWHGNEIISEETFIYSNGFIGDKEILGFIYSDSCIANNTVFNFNSNSS